MTEPDADLAAALDATSGWRVGTDGRTGYRDGGPGWLRTINPTGPGRWMGRVWHGAGGVMDICEIETFDTPGDAVDWCDLFGDALEAVHRHRNEPTVRDGHPKSDGPW